MPVPEPDAHADHSGEREHHHQPEQPKDDDGNELARSLLPGALAQEILEQGEVASVRMEAEMRPTASHRGRARGGPRTRVQLPGARVESTSQYTQAAARQAQLVRPL